MQLHIFPAAWEQSDYVLLDTTIRILRGVDEHTYRDVLGQIERDPAYHLLYHQDSVYLFTRRP